MMLGKKNTNRAVEMSALVTFDVIATKAVSSQRNIEENPRVWRDY